MRQLERSLQPARSRGSMGSGDGLGFERSAWDLRQGAGLLILQSVISFCEDGISARVELQLRNQKRTVAIAVHGFGAMRSA